MAIDSTIQLTGKTLGAVYVRLDTGQVWNGSAYEAITPANFATYLIAGAATGLIDVDGNEIYHFTRPAGLAIVVHYLAIWQRAGGSWVMANDTLLAVGVSERL